VGPCLTCHPQQGDEVKTHPSAHTDVACNECHEAHKAIPECTQCLCGLSSGSHAVGYYLRSGHTVSLLWFMPRRSTRSLGKKYDQTP
jgi:hypothetical protein